jgi:hypothetical protein
VAGKRRLDQLGGRCIARAGPRDIPLRLHLERELRLDHLGGWHPRRSGRLHQCVRGRPRRQHRPGWRLSGFAWGENIGWVNFDTAAALGASGSARLDRAAGRFRGWAWAENLGWLNLDDATAYIALSGGGCYANCDGSTVAPNLNVNDFLCFQNRFAAGDPYANCDASTTPPILNINDFLCFSNRFAVGCP